jgi:hypothetical protein
MRATLETVDWLAAKEAEAWDRYVAKTRGWRRVLWLLLPAYGEREHAAWSVVVRLHSDATIEALRRETKDERHLRLVPGSARGE